MSLVWLSLGVLWAVLVARKADSRVGHVVAVLGSSSGDCSGGGWHIW